MKQIIVVVMNVLLFIFANNLHQTPIETSTILKIIMTIPKTTDEAERTFLELNEGLSM